MEITKANGPPAATKELPLNLLLRELAECLKAASGEDSTSQASETDTLAPQMQRILLQLVKRCTRRRESGLHNHQKPKSLLCSRMIYEACVNSQRVTSNAELLPFHRWVVSCHCCTLSHSFNVDDVTPHSAFSNPDKPQLMQQGSKSCSRWQSW